MKSRASQMGLALSFLVPLVPLVPLVLAGTVSTGCKKKTTTAPAAGDADSTASATPNASASVTVPPTLATPDLTITEFTAKIAPTTCTMLAACKNDKVKATLSMSVILAASFGSMDKPDLAKEMQGVSKSMKADKRFLPSEAECTTIGNIALKVVGVTPDKVGKTLAYDATKGAACLASIATAPEPCKTEVKLAAEPKFKDIDAFGKELHDPLEAYAKPCEDVITGLVEVGAACDSDLECKGKGNKCQKAKDLKIKTKVCTARTPAPGKK